VVDIKELSELSLKLNQKSDTLNAVITSFNEKLAKLNLGVEAWLDEPITAEDPYFLGDDQKKRFPRREVVLLGYCKLDDRWALAIKRATLLTKPDYINGDECEEILTASDIAPLLTAARTVRTNAMRLIPRLLNLIKIEAEYLLAHIEEAEKAAENI
jgi:hypothetical protein